MGAGTPAGSGPGDLGAVSVLSLCLEVAGCPTVDAYPMHEMAAHPDAARLFALFNAHGMPTCGGTMFEPLTTTGVPLAVREDWREVLRAATTASLAQLDELTAVRRGCRSTRPCVLASGASCRPRGPGATSSCARSCPTCCRMPPGSAS